MDVHDRFDYFIPKLIETVEKIKKNSEINCNYLCNTCNHECKTSLEIFTDFLQSLTGIEYIGLRDHLIRVMFEDEGSDFYSKVKKAFNILSDLDTKTIKTMEYTDGHDNVYVKFDDNLEG